VTQKVPPLPFGSGKNPAVSKDGKHEETRTFLNEIFRTIVFQFAINSKFPKNLTKTSQIQKIDNRK
jgi:hypothetical protein